MFKDRLINLSYSRKRFIQIAADFVLLSVAMWAALFLRLSHTGWVLPEGNQIWLFLLAPAVAIPIYIKLGMYRAVMRHLGNDALIVIFKSVTLGFLAFTLVLMVLRDSGFEVMFPRSVFFSYWSLCLMLVGGLRLVARQYFMGDWFASNSNKPQKDELAGGKPVAIYGAGAAGNQLLASLRVGELYRPVAFVDDDESVIGRTIAGLPVYSPDQVGQMMSKTGAKELFMAIPSATRSRRQEVLRTLQSYALHVRTIPGLMDLASGKVKVDDLQEVDIADLLGRDSVPAARSAASCAGRSCSPTQARWCCLSTANSPCMKFIPN